MTNSLASSVSSPRPVSSLRAPSSPRAGRARALGSALALVAALGVSSAPSVALAANPAAEALFQDGKSLMEQGRYSEACPKLEESRKLEYNMVTEFRLAECYEQIGKTASAWSAYTSVANKAAKTGEEEREQVARNRARALEPRLARLRIDVANPVDGMRVTQDGVEVGQGAWGSDVPVDPGEILITACAPGRQEWKQRVAVYRGYEQVTVPNLMLGRGCSGTAAAGPVQLGPDGQPIRYEPRSSVLATVGILGTIGGALILAGGVVWMFDGLGQPDVTSQENWFVPPVALMGVGAGVTAVGVGLWAYGAHKVPVQPQAARYLPLLGAPPVAGSPVPQLSFGPTSVGARWTF